MAILIKDASQLKSKKVRLILPDGPVIIDKFDALTKALTDGLDLILVQDGDLPVVKLVDFAKLEYEQQKAQKNNKPKKPKTIQIGPHTQEFDLKRFALQAVKFMSEGHPTSLKMEVRGRDKAFRDLLTNRMTQFIALIPNAKPGRLSISEDGSTYSQSLN
jgi:translation initiation factor IF-3